MKSSRLIRIRMGSGLIIAPIVVLAVGGRQGGHDQAEAGQPGHPDVDRTIRIGLGRFHVRSAQLTVKGWRSMRLVTTKISQIVCKFAMGTKAAWKARREVKVVMDTEDLSMRWTAEPIHIPTTRHAIPTSLICTNQRRSTTSVREIDR